jgi:tight adherence protein C
MTLRWMLLAGVALWVGATLLLSELRWFSRRPLDERLRPYVPGGWQRPARRGAFSFESFRDVLAPLASTVGDALSSGLGLHDDLPTRLRRIHSPLDPAAMRVRQLVWSFLAFASSGAIVLAAGLPALPGALVVVAAPLLAFLIIEQQVAGRSAAWQRRLFLELPVVSEQIGMLLSAGYSLGSALDRVARRGRGACAQDLARVGRRVRQGLSDTEALQEWATLAEVDAVHRLVGVLSLNRDTGDLGRLIAEEAKAIRREVHRQLAAQIDRRAQQVWIPVTVATLVPGTLFLAVPFLRAMDLYAG